VPRVSRANPSTLSASCFHQRRRCGKSTPAAAAIGVERRSTGRDVLKVATGIRLTGMPAFKGALTENEDVARLSQLAASADKPLPPAAVNLLRGETPAPAVTGLKAKGE